MAISDAEIPIKQEYHIKIHRLGTVNGKKKKKDVQLESSELSFIWRKMRTATQEAASQIALRVCS